MTLIEVLVRGTYFPPEFPPVLKLNEDAMAFIGGACRPVPRGRKVPRTKLLRLSIPQTLVKRRVLSVPNPMSHVYTCGQIADEWKTLQKRFRRSVYSALSPFETYVEDRMSITTTKRNRSTLGLRYDFHLRTDIQAFYESIYTHSIAWALHGLKQSKKRKDDLGLLGNRLDLAIRSSQDGQTNGIPIGPITSRIVAELIGTELDKGIKQGLGKTKHYGLRALDDFFFYVETREEAQRALSAITAELALFNLQINEQKTAVVETPEAFQEAWVRMYRKEAIHSTSFGDAEGILGFFHGVFTTVRNESSSSVAKYVMSRLIELFPEVRRDDFPVLEALVLKLGTLDPRCIERVHRFLREYAAEGHDINRNQLYSSVRSILRRAWRLKHDYEYCWALWLALEWNLPIGKDCQKFIERTNSQIPIIFALLLDEQGLFKFKLNRSPWRELLENEGPDGEYWLLLYEARRRNWLRKANGKQLPTNDFFQRMADRGGAFLGQG